jgi:hypothetical protein
MIGMTRCRLIVLALVVLLGWGAAGGQAQEWRPAQAPLMTRWASQVDPSNPLPEYPRPQLVRKDWLNLNGIWQFEPGAKEDPLPTGKTLSGEILVPFPVESALSGVKQQHDRAWYRRAFTVPSAWNGKRIMLNCDAIDWESEVFVNGRSVDVHKGGYDPFRYNRSKRRRNWVNSCRFCVRTRRVSMCGDFVLDTSAREAPKPAGRLTMNSPPLLLAVLLTRH